MGHTDRGLLISNETDACVFFGLFLFFFLYATTNALSEESIEHIGKQTIRFWFDAKSERYTNLSSS